jgi:hypothetical protein
VFYVVCPITFLLRRNEKGMWKQKPLKKQNKKKSTQNQPNCYRLKAKKELLVYDQMSDFSLINR